MFLPAEYTYGIREIALKRSDPAALAALAISPASCGVIRVRDFSPSPMTKLLAIPKSRRSTRIPGLLSAYAKTVSPTSMSLEIVDFEFVSIEDLKAKTSAGWYIYFNPAYSVDAQIRALEMVLENEIKDSNSLEYIDLRIDNRVYYK